MELFPLTVTLSDTPRCVAGRCVTLVTVVDSDALRSRRKRAHAKNDHRLCRDGCRKREVPAITALIPADAADPGEILDPAASLRGLAARLEAAHQAAPADAALGRVLKDTLLAIAGLDGARGGELQALLDELSA
jgi:hypothetical protein